MIKTLAIALGMSGDSAESDVLSRAARLKQHSEELVKLSGKTTLDEAMGYVLGLREEASKVDGLRAKVEQMELGVRKTDVEKKVDEKVDGFFLEPSKREFAVTLGIKSPEMFDAFLSTLTTKIVNRSIGEAPARSVHVADADIEIPSEVELKALGVTAEDFRSMALQMQKEGSL